MRNIARRAEAWRCLADCHADIALLQEAAESPADLATRFEIGPAPWHTAGAGVNRRWRAAVVKLSDRVAVEWIPAKLISHSSPGELAVSREGTLAVAVVRPVDGESLVVGSMYTLWERPHISTKRRRLIYADAPVHRVISDLSMLIGEEHRIVVAGDLNCFYG